jgi:ribosome-binding factor A
MKNYRPERVGHVIREELSKLIIREFEFGGALVTVTEVETEKKLDRANVLVSVWPAERAADVLKMLSTARSRLQAMLLRKMNIRPMPQIHFLLDRGPEHAAKVEKVLLEE